MEPAMNFTRQTPFHHQQAALGAEFVDRYGFAAAAHYGSVEAEHAATRSAVGVFDVYYQTMIDVQGPDALALLQSVTVNDLSRLAPGSALYTSLCNERGGIVDDLTLFCLGRSHYWLCPTPSRVAKVEAWLNLHRDGREAGVVPLGYRNAYLSVQGPNSRTLLSRLASADLSDAALEYFRFTWDDVAGVPGTMVSRTGYSGELGFELFFPSEYAAHMWERLFEAGQDLGIRPCGLGALVTLRMEKKYPLYGADLTEEISPLEAGLSWTVKLDKGPFVGRQALAEQRRTGVERRLVQFVFADMSADVAPGDRVIWGGGTIGTLTSVAKGFTVGRTLALGYVASAAAVDGTDVAIQAKAGLVPAVVNNAPLYDPERKRLLGRE
jgi:aminomethyltransferase